MTEERTAQNEVGFLLRSPGTEDLIFRQYDQEDKDVFTDYAVQAEDIKVEIMDDTVALYPDGPRLDYTAQVLGREPGREKLAAGVVGHLLYNPLKERYWFRVYEPQVRKDFYESSDNRRRKHDYRLRADIVELKILNTGLSFYEGAEPCLTWANRFLRKHPSTE